MSQECLFSLDEEADLHLCPIMHGAGGIVHVTGSRGEPRFSSPPAAPEPGAARRGSERGSGEVGRGDGRRMVNSPEFNYLQLPP